MINSDHLCSLRGSAAWSRGPAMTGYPTHSPSSVWHTRWSWASTAETPCWPGMPASATAWEKVSGLASCKCCKSLFEDVKCVGEMCWWGEMICCWETHQRIQRVFEYQSWGVGCFLWISSTLTGSHWSKEGIDLVLVSKTLLNKAFRWSQILNYLHDTWLPCQS